MDFDNLSEKELLKACIQRNEEAWNAFVKKYESPIYSTIEKTLITYNSYFLYHDMDDIYHEVFLSLHENNYRKLRQYEGKNNCKVATWLKVVTKRLTINYIIKSVKRQKKYKPLEVDPPGPQDPHEDPIVIEYKEILEKLIKDWTSKEKEIFDLNLENNSPEEITKKILEELVKELNPKERRFYKLHYEEKLSPKEIAEKMGRKVGTVYSYKSRITEKFKKIAKKKDLLQDN